mgnify:CR=1 FL=1
MTLNSNHLYKNIYFFNGVAGFLLMLTLTPLGKTIKGSHRWLDLGSFSFQPGELVKYTLCLSAIYFFNNYNLLSNTQIMETTKQNLITGKRLISKERESLKETLVMI